MNAAERRNVIFLALQEHYRWRETADAAICVCRHELRNTNHRLWEETTNADLDTMHQNHVSGVIERVIRGAA